MKKSTALLLLIVSNTIYYYITNNLEMIVLSNTILAVGYFIVKQLEDNQNTKP